MKFLKTLPALALALQFALPTAYAGIDISIGPGGIHFGPGGHGPGHGPGPGGPGWGPPRGPGWSPGWSGPRGPGWRHGPRGPGWGHGPRGPGWGHGPRGPGWGHGPRGPGWGNPPPPPPPPSYNLCQGNFSGNLSDGREAYIELNGGGYNVNAQVYYNNPEEQFSAYGTCQESGGYASITLTLSNGRVARGRIYLASDNQVYLDGTEDGSGLTFVYRRE